MQEKQKETSKSFMEAIKQYKDYPGLYLFLLVVAIISPIVYFSWRGKDARNDANCDDCVNRNAICRTLYLAERTAKDSILREKDVLQKGKDRSDSIILAYAKADAAREKSEVLELKQKLKTQDSVYYNVILKKKKGS